MGLPNNIEYVDGNVGCSRLIHWCVCVVVVIRAVTPHKHCQTHKPGDITDMSTDNKYIKSNPVSAFTNQN